MCSVKTANSIAVREEKRSASKPRLILHAGTMKTGTTTIQKLLSQNREYLRKQGIYYPDSKPFMSGSSEAHFSLAHASAMQNKSALKQAHQFMKHVRDEVQAGETVVLSSEPISVQYVGMYKTKGVSSGYWRRRRAYFKTLKRLLQEFDVHVLLFLRRQDLYAESYYKERVKKAAKNAKSTVSFQEFIHNRRHNFNYSAQINLMERIFDTVVPRSYHSGSIVSNFFDELEVEAPSGNQDIWERRSPDVRLVLWYVQHQPRDPERFYEFLLSDEARNVFASDRHLTLWESMEARCAFIDQFEGPYGKDFFTPPDEHGKEPAHLTRKDAQKISQAYKRWLKCE